MRSAFRELVTLPVEERGTQKPVGLSGVSGGFRALYDRHQARVYTMALRFSGDPSQAQDITQTVFMKVYRNLETYRGDAQFSTWLYRIVWNVCRDHHRKKRLTAWLPFSETPEVATIPTRDSPDRSYLQREQQIRIAAAIEQLPPNLRMPILLKYLEDLTYREIATALGWRLGTVASRLNRAHKMLAKKLADLRPMEGCE